MKSTYTNIVGSHAAELRTGDELGTSRKEKAGGRKSL